MPNIVYLDRVATTSLGGWVLEAMLPHLRNGPAPSELPRGNPSSLHANASGHCLTSCCIGEVLGLIIADALEWGSMVSIALAVVLLRVRLFPHNVAAA